MAKKPIIYIFHLLSIMSVFAACSLDSSSKKSDQVTNISDEFYTKTGGFDHQRIPLLRPYQAININKKSWSIDLQTKSIRYQPSINDILRIGVANDLIVTYSLNSLLEGVAVEKAWFVLSPSKRIERGFSDFNEMSNFIKKLGMLVPELKDANLQYKLFINGKRLHWFPKKG